MNTHTFTIFIELDSILKNIDDYNYEAYNDLFFSMLKDVNRIKRKIIFVLKDRKVKRIIKKYFHEDFFEYFEIINIENLDKIKSYIIDNGIDTKTSFAILSCPDTIETFREMGVYTSYLKMSENDLSEQKALETVDYQKAVFTNLFDINYDNLIFETQKFNDESEE